MSKKTEKAQHRGEDAPKQIIDVKILRDSIAGVITNCIAILAVFNVSVPWLTETRAGQIASGAAILISWSMAYWYNHNHTDAAKRGQEKIDAIKASGKALDATETKEA